MRRMTSKHLPRGLSRVQPLHLGVGLLGLLSFAGCQDYLTGHAEEPTGPLQVLRLTLSDAHSRQAAVFTDTSLPDCKQMPDCTQSSNASLPICRVCYNDVFKDRYSPKNSPPTPDSGQDIRVVFNKVALKLGSVDLAVSDSDKDDVAGAGALKKSVKLSCTSCAGLPELTRQLFLTGSDVTFDPTTIPYGPSIQMAVDTSDPRAALEPGREYTVELDKQIAGRNGEPWPAPADQLALLKFSTEAFRVTKIFQRVKEGQQAAPWTLDEWLDKPLAGTHTIGGQSPLGAITLVFNASLHLETVKAATVTVQDATGMAIPAKLGTNAFDPKTCKTASARELYIFPETGDWPDTGKLTIRVAPETIKDVAQTAMFPVGASKLSSEISLSVVLDKAGGEAHVKNTDARKATACVP